MRQRVGLTFVIAITLAAAAARAQSPGYSPSSETAEAVTTRSYQDASGYSRARVVDDIITSRRILGVGVEMAFVTAEADELDEGELKFTDVGIFRLRSSLSLGGWAEMGAAVQLLPKQPSMYDEPVFQGAALTFRAKMSRRLALVLRGGGGPMTGEQGFYGTGDLVLQGKRSIHETVLFTGNLGGSMTGLRFLEPSEGGAWFSEVIVGGDLTIRSPGSEFALWVGIEMRVPVVDDADMAYEIDPQTRLGFHTGTLYGFVRNWDIYVDYSVIDRGDREVPTTLLPVLDGGFDQQQLVFGVIRRFDITPKPPKPREAWDMR